jgi:plasmid maintenance system antidote protein VapI
MRQHQAAQRYRATAELRNRIAEQGRQQIWLAEQIGMSKSQLTHVVKQRRTISEVQARILAGILGARLGLLFELPDGTNPSVNEQSEAAA